MNHLVPEFDMDEGEYFVPSSSGPPRQKNMQEDEILELLWQNGQVVVQSQNPRLLRKPSPPPHKFSHHLHQEPQKHHQPPSQVAPLPPDSAAQLFMPEDEMISWLQCPLEFDRDLTDLFLPPGTPPPTSAALRPPLPIPPIAQPQHHNHRQPQLLPQRPEAPETDVNFPQLSRTTTRIQDSGPSTSSRNNNNVRRDSTVVDSSDTPAVRQKLKIPLPTKNTVEIADGGNRCRDGFGGGEIGGASTAASGGGGGCMSMNTREIDTCDLTLASSPSGSGGGASLSATATADLMSLQSADDRKRKGREPVDEVNGEYQSEDVEIKSYEQKKQARGATTKRSRAAEVHNMSERRRRDRINEKMKVLQELIPRCSKTDKASMLDEAIDYLKSLQMQVQMMSMGCGMVPVMFPGVQQYMPSMGMGMGMGMSMEMGMTRPMMPFPGVLSGSALPTPGAPSHLNPRFPLQAFQMPPMPGPDPSRVQQGINQGDAFVNPGLNMATIPSFTDPYQQCVAMQQVPVQIPQNQLTRQPSISMPSANRGGVDK